MWIVTLKGVARLLVILKGMTRLLDPKQQIYIWTGTHDKEKLYIFLTAGNAANCLLI